MHNEAICLMGPTAVGKTDLACRWVDEHPYEIVSVDAVMIYRGMNIGTAKPDATLLKKYPHHLIDILNPDESYSVAQFRDDALAVCDAIWARGNTPLLVGGTMMYFKALQQGLSDLPEGSPDIRAAILKEAAERGWPALHEELQRVDPQAAKRIHPHDTQRIQRALEVYRLTGEPWSTFHAEKSTSDVSWRNLICMPDSRAELHERIAKRFRQMIKTGLVEEVRALVEQWGLTLDHPALRAVGYRQVYQYLQGQYDLTTLEEKGIVATRQLAKRQLTWLRHWPDGEIIQPYS